MSFESGIVAWRRYRHLTQKDLAAKAGLARPYISRLEKGDTDPTLSTLRRLAFALDVELGELLERRPPEKTLNRHELDQLARGAIRPGTKEARRHPETRVLARMLSDQRKALGVYVPRKSRNKIKQRPTGPHAIRWLRSSLGEDQWNALISRIDKLSSQIFLKNERKARKQSFL